MTNLAMWSVIVGALTPPVVALVQNPAWSAPAKKWIRVAIMVLFAVADGIGTAWIQGSLTWTRWSDSALIAGVAIITAYNGIWKPAGVTPAIEAKSLDNFKKLPE